MCWSWWWLGLCKDCIDINTIHNASHEHVSQYLFPGDEQADTLTTCAPVPSRGRRDQTDQPSVVNDPMHQHAGKNDLNIDKKRLLKIHL